MKTINITGYALNYASYNPSTRALNATYQRKTFNAVLFDRVLTNKTGAVAVDATTQGSFNIVAVAEKDGTIYGVRITEYNADEGIRELSVFDLGGLTSPLALEGAQVLANFGTSKYPNTEAVVEGYSKDDWTPSEINGEFVLPIVDSNGELVGWYPNCDEARKEVEDVIASEIALETEAIEEAQDEAQDEAIEKIIEEATEKAVEEAMKKIKEAQDETTQEDASDEGVEKAEANTEGGSDSDSSDINGDGDDSGYDDFLGEDIAEAPTESCKKHKCKCVQYTSKQVITEVFETQNEILIITKIKKV